MLPPPPPHNAVLARAGVLNPACAALCLAAVPWSGLQVKVDRALFPAEWQSVVDWEGAYGVYYRGLPSQAFDRAVVIPRL